MGDFCDKCDHHAFEHGGNGCVHIEVDDTIGHIVKCLCKEFCPIQEITEGKIETIAKDLMAEKLDDVSMGKLIGMIINRYSFSKAMFDSMMNSLSSDHKNLLLNHLADVPVSCPIFSSFGEKLSYEPVDIAATIRNRKE